MILYGANTVPIELMPWSGKDGLLQTSSSAGKQTCPIFWAT